MSTYLPNTSLTSLSVGPRIFAYAQGYHGNLIEFQGRLQTSKKFENFYYSNGHTSIGPTARWRHGEIQPTAPKMFTPLAAASLEDTRASISPKVVLKEAHVKQYLIYLNDDNILHDVVYEDSEWKEGTLSKYEQVDGRPGVRCAPYSKLAAATVTLNSKPTICVYYQTDEKNGSVSVISFTPGNSWNGLERILALLLELKDPPLYGTSLTTVKPRQGITVAKADKKDSQAAKDAAETAKQLPVVYLQWDTNALAHGQGTSKLSLVVESSF
jgi:hypothetical protein